MATKDPNANIDTNISSNSLNYHLVTTEEMARQNRGGMDPEHYFALVAQLDYEGKKAFDRLIETGAVGTAHPLDRF